MIFYDVMIERYEFLKPSRQLIELVNDRDIWLNKDPRSKQLNILHWIYGDNQFTDRFLENPNVSPLVSSISYHALLPF